MQRWRLVATVCLLAVGAGLVHYFVTPRSYRATTTLQIEQRTFSPVGSEHNPWLDAWVTMKYYPTQYRLLRSRGLAERVVADLNLMDDAEFNPARARLPAGGEEESAVRAAEDQAVLARLANRLLAGLTIDPIEETELVAVAYTSNSPRLAARVANGVAETFIDWGIETRSETVGRASAFLTTQIDTLKREIDDKEAQLQEYSRRTDIVALEPGSNATLQKLSLLNTELSGAVAERLDREARYLELRAAPAEAVADQETGGSVAEIRRELRRLEGQYETGLKTYKPEWPEMRDLQGRIDEVGEHLRRQIAEEADKARQAAYAALQTALRRERSLEAEIKKVKSEALDLGQAAVEYNNLKMEIRTRRELQDDLLKQLSEAGVTARLSGSKQTNVRIVDRALVPSGPFRPSLRTDLSVSLAAGLLLGVVLVLLIHFLDRTVKNGDELEALLGLPVLALIPDLSEGGRGYGYRHRQGYGQARLVGSGGGSEKGRRTDPQPLAIELLPELQPRLAVSESYRSLRTALLLSSAEQLAVITVTSAGAGEGKTATAANLAVVMAHLGRRVLLIDADLRKPRLHEVLQVSNRAGLVNYLTGGAEAREVVQATEIANLSICPAGPHPPNPSDLLSSARMGEFVQQAREEFDFVIVDTPPVLAVSDAVLTGSLSDGLVLCFRANQVLREDVVSCRDRLLLAGLRILGAVLNRYTPSRSGGYDRRYYYHYETYGEVSDAPASDSAA